jgi:mannose-1-phosphate guanylyltransferase
LKTLSPSARDLQHLDGLQVKATLPSVSNGQAHCAVVLAGGNGTRLQSLTLKISRYLRPKQFCGIFGGESLLSRTWQRLRPLFGSDHTIFVFTMAHERFHREELPRAENSLRFVQPENRGTAVGITAAILGIIRSDIDAIMALFPCDHYNRGDDAFALTIRSAMAFAEEHPTSLILLGAQAHYQEVEYGWIEPGRRSAVS